MRTLLRNLRLPCPYLNDGHCTKYQKVRNEDQKKEKDDTPKPRGKAQTDHGDWEAKRGRIYLVGAWTSTKDSPWPSRLSLQVHNQTTVQSKNSAWKNHSERKEPATRGHCPGRTPKGGVGASGAGDDSTPGFWGNTRTPSRWRAHSFFKNTANANSSIHMCLNDTC